MAMAVRIGNLSKTFLSRQKIFGIELISDTAFPELTAAYDTKSTLRFKNKSIKIQETDVHWYHHWEVQGSCVLSFGKLGTKYILRNPLPVYFLVNQHGIICLSNSDDHVQTMRHLLLDQVIPLALSHQGNLVFHGSAVLTSQGVVAFIAESGRGKSTLARAFGRRGMAVITDDVILTKYVDGGFEAVPSYPGLRLWPDMLSQEEMEAPLVTGYSNKRRINKQVPFHSDPAPLRAIYFLTEPSNCFKITSMPKRNSLFEFINHSFLLDCKDPQSLRFQFEEISRLVNSGISICELSYPRSASYLDRVVDHILAHVGVCS